MSILLGGTARFKCGGEIAQAEDGVESGLGCVPAASAVDQGLYGDAVDVERWSLG